MIVVQNKTYKSMQQACLAYNLIQSTVARRIEKGWTIEEAFNLSKRPYSSQCKGSVYKICNRKNSKLYIGVTTVSLDLRLKQHFTHAKKKQTKLAKAINKIGEEHFYIKLIRTTCTEKLRDLEMKYIKKYNSIKKGYNTMVGGSSLGRSRGKPVTLDGVIYASQTAVAQYLNISPGAVHRRIKSQVDLKKGRSRGGANSKKVKYRNQIYSSVSELSRFLKIPQKTIAYRLNQGYCLNGEPSMTGKKGFYTGDYV